MYILNYEDVFEKVVSGLKENAYVNDLRLSLFLTKLKSYGRHKFIGTLINNVLFCRHHYIF